MKAGMLLVVLAVCASADAPRAETPASLGVAGRTNATPSIAARGEVVAVAWSATANGVTDVYAATSTDGGRAFGSPVRVNDAASAASVSGEQPPRVALIPRERGRPLLDVVWTAKSAAGTRLLSAVSADGGMSFGPATAIASPDARGNRGWESTAVDAQGHVIAVWLDHRELVEQSGAMHHDGQAHTGHGDADGVARAQLSKLYFARVGEPGGGRPIASGVCYCCKTAIAAGEDGTIFAAWRHVYPGNIRDIAFTLSRDGGRTFAAPARVSDDRWVLDGCPENGPAIAADARGTVHIVWPTLVSGASPADEPALALFYTTTRDGKTFAARTRIPTDGTPRHPQIAVDGNGRVLVAWDEQLAGSRRVVIDEAVGADGGLRFANLATIAGERSEYPTAAPADRGFVVAWTAPSAVRVSRVGDR